MSNSPKYDGEGLSSGSAMPVRIKTVPCAPSKLTGAPAGSCEPAIGGDKTIKTPGFVLSINNGPLGFGDCDIWQDDDNQLVKEANNDYICIDNA